MLSLALQFWTGGARAASPGAAQELLAPGDAVELANVLAEATEEQGVCYGWNVVINGQQYASSPAALAAIASAETATPTGTPSPPPILDDSQGHLGSNAGPGIRVSDVPACERWAEFTARLTYTSEYSESEDSASYELSSNFLDFTGEDREKLGIDNGALLGDQDDTAVFTATAALPLIVADKGGAPHATAEPNSVPLPPADEATGSPGSDVLRSDPFLVAVALILVGAGIAWLVYLVVMERPQRRFARAHPQRHPTDWEP